MTREFKSLSGRKCFATNARDLWSSFAFVASAVAVLTLSCVARAQRAMVATPAELPPQGISHLLDVAILGEYSHVAESTTAGGLRDSADFALRNRLYLGRTVSYCAGLDGKIGGSNTGFLYDVTGYILGLGKRWGEANVISLCGGAGMGRVGSAVPLAATLPAELSVALSLGPVRPIIWARPSWIVGDSARRKGATFSFIDEIETGVLLRLAKQHRYWSRTSAGGGLTIGVSYRELMQTHAISAFVGFDFAGEQ